MFISKSCGAHQTLKQQEQHASDISNCDNKIHPAKPENHNHIKRKKKLVWMTSDDNKITNKQTHTTRTTTQKKQNQSIINHYGANSINSAGVSKCITRQSVYVHTVCIRITRARACNSIVIWNSCYRRQDVSTQALWTRHKLYWFA